MTKQDMKYFKMAKKMAIQSDFNAIHIGCILVYQGTIIGSGYNTYKTHPEQRYYNQFREIKDIDHMLHALHAEMKALISVSYEMAKKVNWKKVKVYIYRPRISQKYGNSRPCPACMQKLINTGIRHIYYTTDNGYAEEILTD